MGPCLLFEGAHFRLVLKGKQPDNIYFGVQISILRSFWGFFFSVFFEQYPSQVGFAGAHTPQFCPFSDWFWADTVGFGGVHAAFSPLRRWLGVTCGFPAPRCPRRGRCWRRQSMRSAARRRIGGQGTPGDLQWFCFPLGKTGYYGSVFHFMGKTG